MRPTGPLGAVAGGVGVLGLAWLLSLGAGEEHAGQRVAYRDVTFEVPENWSFSVRENQNSEVGFALGPVAAFEVTSAEIELGSLQSAAGWDDIDVAGVRALDRERTAGGELVREVVVDGRLFFRFHSQPGNAEAAAEVFDRVLASVEFED